MGGGGVRVKRRSGQIVLSVYGPQCVVSSKNGAKTKPEVVYSFCPSTPQCAVLPVGKGGGGIKSEGLCLLREDQARGGIFLLSIYGPQCAVLPCKKGGRGKTNEVLPVSGPVLQERVRRGSHGEVVNIFESAAG